MHQDIYDWIAAKAAACGIDENDPTINIIWERWEQGEYSDAPEWRENNE